jgi:hypothetical protein
MARLLLHGVRHATESAWLIGGDAVKSDRRPSICMESMLQSSCIESTVSYSEATVMCGGDEERVRKSSELFPTMVLPLLSSPLLLTDTTHRYHYTWYSTSLLPVQHAT